MRGRRRENWEVKERVFNFEIALRGEPAEAIRNVGNAELIGI